MASLNLAEVFRARARLKSAIRAFFAGQDYTEIDTPVAVQCPGTETHLRYFPTTWQDFRGASYPLWLRSSPELHMKQALALGASPKGRIFQLGPCFRSGGELSDWHHPEFTMLEWYQTEISVAAFIDQTEALLRFTHAHFGSQVALPSTLPRITVAEAFARWAGIKLVDGDADLAARAISGGILSPLPQDDFETAFFKILLERIEPGIAALGGAVLLDYPPSQAALARVENGVAKRFEFYLGRVELSNGFGELLSAAANRQRVQATLEKRRAFGYELPAEDEDFYGALAVGLPPCCGNALGFDRWLALLTGASSLDAVIPFRRAQPYATQST